MKKYIWYLHRLRVMSGAELIRRVWVGARLKLKQLALSENSEKRTSKKIMKIIRSAHVSMFKPPFYAETEQDFIHEYKKRFPQGLKQCLEQAEQICAHKFEFLGCKPVAMGRSLKWNVSFETGTPWPMNHWAGIDYRHRPDMGEIKLPWELSRHQYFLVLGKAYRLTGEEKYAREFVAQIGSWIDKNPPERGINWIIKLDMGIRMISWLWAYHFFKNSQYFTRTVQLRMLTSMYRQTEHIYNNLSFGSSANNHLIGQAAALFIIGSFFSPLSGQARHWQQKGIKILAAQIKRQVFTDGCSKEQSTSYHAFVLDFYLLVLAVAGFHKISLPPIIRIRTQKMCEFLMYMQNFFSTIPRIGDGDEGQAVKFRLEQVQNYQACLSSGAVLFKRGDFKIAAKNFAEKSFWLLGVKAWDEFDKLKTVKTKPASCCFAQSGYYILAARKRGRTISLLFDCGPLGLGRPAGHGHADALSFILEVNGCPVFIDPGTFTYTSPLFWRSYFRGTSAHNTLVVDGQDQSLSGGPFIWLKKAQCFITHWQSNNDVDNVAGRHTGYLGLKDPVSVKREIIFDKRRLTFTIKDNIQARELHMVEQYFHYAAGCTVKKVSEGIYKVILQNMQVILEADPRCLCNLYIGHRQPVLGWSAQRYGRKSKSPTLRAWVRNAGGLELITRISIKL